MPVVAAWLATLNGIVPKARAGSLAPVPVRVILLVPVPQFKPVFVLVADGRVSVYSRNPVTPSLMRRVLPSAFAPRSNSTS